jgi:hypothetical protein
MAELPPHPANRAVTKNAIVRPEKSAGIVMVTITSDAT